MPKALAIIDSKCQLKTKQVNVALLTKVNIAQFIHIFLTGCMLGIMHTKFGLPN